MTTSERVFKETKDDVTKYYKRIRIFLGKIDDFATPEERAKEQRHLKAYLTGATRYRFQYSTDPSTGSRVPQWFPVLEGVKLTEITEDEYNKAMSIKRPKVEELTTA